MINNTHEMHAHQIWNNDNIQFIFHSNIVEYDMSQASVSICERFKLLDDSTIQRLKLMSKHQRTVEMGLMQRDNKEFSEQLLKGIRDIRRKFIQVNELTEEDIITIHSDAIFFIMKKDIIDEIEGVKFKRKNTWTSFIRYDKMEMFYDGNGIITYKGVPRELLDTHTLGLNKYMIKIFTMIENYDSSVLKFLSKFQKNYLQDKLPDFYYISFGKRGEYKIYNMKLLSYIASITLIESKSWRIQNNKR